MGLWESPAAAAAKALQSCPTLCDPIDGSPPGSAVPGILQARTLEWVAISSPWEVAKELNIVHSVVIQHLKQIGKVKNLDKWVPHDLTENQKNHCLEVSSALMLCNSYEPFFDQIVVCYEKWILYNNWQQPAQWLDWEDALKHFPKPNVHQKIVMVTVWWSAAGLIHYSFLSPGETVTFEKYAQQIDVMHQKLQLLQLAFVNCQ